MERPEKALAYWRRIAKNPPADVDGNKLVNWIEELEGRLDMAKAIIGLGDLSEAGWIAMLLDSLNGIPIVNELENAIRILHGERT